MSEETLSLKVTEPKKPAEEKSEEKLELKTSTETKPAEEKAEAKTSDKDDSKADAKKDDKKTDGLPKKSDSAEDEKNISSEGGPVLYVKDLKNKPAEGLVALAKEASIEGANFMLKQELIFHILKVMAETNQGIIVFDGVLEIMQDGFGFLRSKEYNYRAGPDDVYVSPNQIKRFALRTGDAIEGEVRPPKARERYFALTKIFRTVSVGCAPCFKRTISR